MRLSSYQPQYFPRLHYFARILDSDIFTISDYVQFVRDHSYPTPDGGTKRGKSYQAHTPVKLTNGVHLLGVPIKSHQGLTPIHKTKIDYTTPWVEKHVKTFETAYAKAKNLKHIYPQLSMLLSCNSQGALNAALHCEHLGHLNVLSILWALCWILGAWDVTIRDMSLGTVNELLGKANPFRLKKVIILSETDIDPPGIKYDATDWIIEKCRRLGTEEYYCGGTAAQAYMDFTRFEKAGIKIITQEWMCAPYTQQHAKAGFIPNLSIIDLLMNEDNATVVRVLRGAYKVREVA